MPDTFGLTPRQQDIYNAMREEGILTPDGKPITPQWIKISYPSTLIQPRRKKKTSSKIKRKKQVKK
jgi:hypothetical protein